MKPRALLLLTVVAAACSGRDGGSDSDSDTGDAGSSGDFAAEVRDGADAANDAAGSGEDSGDAGPGETDVGGEDGPGEDTTDEEVAPECITATDCNFDAIDVCGDCVGGACVEGTCPEDYAPGAAWSWVSRVDLPPGDEPCCFDFNGNGAVDNALGGLVGSFVSDPADINQELLAAIERGDFALLLELHDLPEEISGGATLPISFFDATNDVEPRDGSGDQTWEERASGAGMFQLLRQSFGIDGARVRAEGSNISEGVLRTSPFEFRLLVPIPDMITLDLTISDAIIEAPVRRVETGLAVDDETLEGGAIVGGGRLGGVITLETLKRTINDLARDCSCAGIAPDAPDLLLGGETDSRFELECNPDVDFDDSGCTDDDGILCTELQTICGALVIINAIADVDTNENGVPDSVSIGLRVGLAGASIATPALAP